MEGGSLYQCVHRGEGTPSVVQPCISVCEMEEQGSWGLCWDRGGLLSGDPKVKAVGPSHPRVTASLTSSFQSGTPPSNTFRVICLMQLSFF